MDFVHLSSLLEKLGGWGDSVNLNVIGNFIGVLSHLTHDMEKIKKLVSSFK